ncbi:hypothetical protein HOI71_15685, partial [Candidatus Poribacteria bacterium]|nr:hypothetical protein [Candidatus Poribacteria bacterium]
MLSWRTSVRSVVSPTAVLLVTAVIGLLAVPSAAQDGVDTASGRVVSAVRAYGEREGIVAPIRREVGSIRELLDGLRDEQSWDPVRLRLGALATTLGDLELSDGRVQTQYELVVDLEKTATQNRSARDEIETLLGRARTLLDGIREDAWQPVQGGLDGLRAAAVAAGAASAAPAATAAAPAAAEPSHPLSLVLAWGPTGAAAISALLTVVVLALVVRGGRRPKPVDDVRESLLLEVANTVSEATEPVQRDIEGLAAAT